MEDISWADLPSEILSKIFSFFSFYDRSLTLSLVCTNWAEVCYDPLLVLSYTINGNDMCHNEILQQLRAAPHLKYLRIVHRNDLNSFLRDVGKHNRKLRSLTIKNCFGSTKYQKTVSASVLITLLTKCNTLEELTFKYTPFRSKKLFNRLGTMIPKLKKINLTSNIDSTNLLMLIKDCKYLESIKFTPHFMYSVQDKHIKEICNEIGTRLKTLKLHAVFLTDKSIDSLLRRCTGLETVHLIRPHDLSEIGIFKMTQFSGLKSLGISKTPVDWLGIDFFQKLTSTLKVLNLSDCCCVTDPVLVEISKYCRRLEKLNLSKCCNFTYIGLTYIFRDCRFLTRLNVYLTTPGLLKELSSLLILYKVKRLQRLIYRPDETMYWNIIDKELQRIQQSFPGIKFVSTIDNLEDDGID